MIKSYSSSLRAQAFLEKVLDELDTSDPEEALRLLRRMKQLLAEYRESQQQLQRLGLEGADDVLDAMMAMKRRVEHLQAQLDAHREAHEKLRAIQDTLDPDLSAEETVRAVEDINAQLEALYEERELLSEAGVSDADEAVRLIESMREQLDQVYENMDAAKEKSDFDLLEEELGVSDPASVVELVKSMEDQLAAEPNSDAASPSSGSSAPPLERLLDRQLRALHQDDVPLPTEEFSPLLPSEVLENVQASIGQNESELDTGGLGAVVLDDEDRIRHLSRGTPPLPHLADASVGDRFFEHVPPARTPIFRDSLREGRRTGRLDARFWYAFSRSDASPPIAAKIHLRRLPDTPQTWVLYDVVQ